MDDHAAVAELAALVVPGTCASQTIREIWECVNQKDARLPGAWNATAVGALTALRNCDWAICTYLAARCLKDAEDADVGRRSLAAPVDGPAHNNLWLKVVDPIVVNIPKGLERMLVEFDGKTQWITTDQLQGYPALLHKDLTVTVQGQGKGVLAKGLHNSAEHFFVGNTLDLSQWQWRGPKLKRLMLSKADALELRSWVQGAKGQDALPAFFNREVRQAPVPGGCFHVLAYPLAGDLRKALLRPTGSLWGASQKVAAQDVLRSFGETLLSQCAKSGLWDLVEMLIQEGVPCPNLRMEYVDLCGNSPELRRDWKHDLGTACGIQTRSLLELALKAKGEQPLRGILSAMQEHGNLPDLNDTAGNRMPLIVAAANLSRWDLVRVLLELEDVDISVDPLMNLPVLSKAPDDVKELCQANLQKKDMFGSRAQSMKEFFVRSLSGESMSDQVAPSHVQMQDGVLKSVQGLQVLDQGLRLVGAVLGSEADVAFVSVSHQELDKAKDVIAEGTGAILPIDLHDRTATLQDPKGCGAWLPVLCSKMQLRNAGNEYKLCIPENCVPYPCITLPTAQVRVTTACCGKSVEGVLIHCGGKRAGMTDADGIVKLALPPGKHVLTTPGYSDQKLTICIEHGSNELQDVDFPIDGKLFFFLQDMSFEEGETRIGVKLCTNQYNIPSEALPYRGSASILGVSASAGQTRTCSSMSFRSLLSIGKDVTCGEALLTLQVKPTADPGLKYEVNPDAEEWFDNFRDECAVNLLFTGTPLPLGYLTGKKIDRESVAKPEGKPAVAKAAVPTPVQPDKDDEDDDDDPSKAVSEKMATMQSKDSPASLAPLPQIDPLPKDLFPKASSGVEPYVQLKELLEGLQKTFDARLSKFEAHLGHLEDAVSHLQEKAARKREKGCRSSSAPHKHHPRIMR